MTRMEEKDWSAEPRTVWRTELFRSENTSREDGDREEGAESAPSSPEAGSRVDWVVSGEGGPEDRCPVR